MTRLTPTARRTTLALTLALMLAPLGSALGVLPAAPAAAAGCPAPGGSGVPEAAGPAGAEVTVLGHGYGHGLGMSQYGAQGAARLGCNHVQILQAYYRDSRVTTQAATGVPVLLTLLRGGRSASVTAEAGAVTWIVPGTTTRAVQAAGSTWTVTGSGSTALLREGSTTRLAVPGAALRAIGARVRVRTYASSSSPVVDLRMRWDYTRFTPTSGGLDVVQVIQDDSRGDGVQKYLWGLREVPVSWPQESLRAQAVAARTYLYGKYSSSQQAYVLSTTTADQNYGGALMEDEDARYGSGWRRAVDATPGRVVVDPSGRRIDTLYSSSAGGHTEDRVYVWGTPATSYLKAVDDSTWDRASDNPYRSWSAGFTRAQVARAFGFDTVTAISVAGRGTGERLAGVRVTGTDAGRATTRMYTGDKVRSYLGLRSSGVTFRMAPTTPPPPPPIVPGVTGLVAVAGDWDGDGRDDVGWYNGGAATLRLGSGAVVRFGFGRPGDQVVVGDWNGDGRDSLGVFRAGRWYLRNALSSGQHDLTFTFGGAPGDRAVTGTWRGGRGVGVGVVRGTTWYLRHTASAGATEATGRWGRSTDRPLVGDWDGNGTETPGLFRAPAFYLSNALTPMTSAASLLYGGATDRLAVVGDWDGDGRATPGVVRGTSFLLRDDLAGGPATRTVVLAR